MQNFFQEPIRKKNFYRLAVLAVFLVFSLPLPSFASAPNNIADLGQYGDFLWFIFPILSFIICFSLWERYGRDPKVNKAIVPEFEISECLTPIEVGTLEGIGDFKDFFISAAIVGLAVKRYINTEEVDRKWSASGKDFKFKKNRPEEDFLRLSLPEKILVEGMFKEKKEIFLSLLKDRFYKDAPRIKDAVVSDFALMNLMTKTGSALKKVFIITACVIFFVGFFLFTIFGSAAVALSAIISVFIFIIFGFFMPKRTPKGAGLIWRIKGLRMYMERAEKYCQQENIFESLLPYAMIFGMMDSWAKKMEEIYGQEYFQNYHPDWYAASVPENLSADIFIERMNVLSSGIAASVGAVSGSGGRI